MKEEIFVFTASGRLPRQHRERTIDQVVGLDEVEPVAARIGAALRAKGLEEVRCWGSVPTSGNRSSWQRMQPGHWGLLYGGEDRFPWLLRVGHKAQSKTLARQLWDEDSEGQTWELMFFFDLALRVDLGLGEVREALAYPGGVWRPQGLQYPRAEHQEALLASFGSIAGFAASVAEETTVEAIAPTPDELMMGGKFQGPPDKPPRARRPRQPPDPDRSGRGYMAHERTVDKLCKYVGPTFRKGKSRKGINHDGAWKVDGAFCMAEVKSTTPANEVEQLQKGLGQILHNLFKAEENSVEIFAAYLIAECEPRNSSLWRRLAKKHGVVFTWPERFEADIERP
jgi:hypothetical protein